MILNRKPTDVFKDVSDFAELAQPNMLVPFGQPIITKAIELAIGLIDEECNKEYIPALRQFLISPTRENLIAVIDGGMDTIYVVAWAMRVMNVDGAAYWNEVQRSNMAKFPAYPNEKYLAVPLEGAYDDVSFEVNIRKGRAVLTNADTGKVIKPQGWTQPDLFGVMSDIEMIHKMRNQPDKVATTMLMEYFHTIEGRREKGEITL